MFFAFMIFLSIFLIAFCHRANSNMSKKWMESSFIGILIDQVALELAAAIIVGLIVVAKKRFKLCSCMIFIAVLI